MIKPLQLCFLLFLLLPLAVFADAPSWEIIPNESKITFTGIQNNAPVSGEFKSFHGNIKGDINKLDESSVTLTIDMNSISTSFKDLEDTLKTADWFDIKMFPTATFTSSVFTKLKQPNMYKAEGKLTIREKTLPLNVVFVVESYVNDKATIRGSVPVMRTVYGVGRGEWGSTDDVKNEVKVDFVLTAKKKT